MLIFRPLNRELIFGVQDPQQYLHRFGDAVASVVVVEHYIDHSLIRMWPTLFLVGWPSPEELARLSLSGVSVIRLTGNSDRGRASEHTVLATITITITIFGINCLSAGEM